LFLYRKTTFFSVDFVSCYAVEEVYGVEKFLGGIFGYLRYRIMSSANRDILTVSLPICIPFIFSFLPYCSD
jgi:hypothetical protein